MQINPYNPNFKKAMTHESFTGVDGSGNSRFIFKGMFSFKGKVADVLFDWVPGKGQILQHILGNHFSNKRLVEIYDNLNLNFWVRYGKNFDIIQYKHVFVYSYLGYLMETMNEGKLKSYILNEFLDYNLIEPHLLTKFNATEQLKFLCKMKYNALPKIELSNKNELYQCNILVNKDIMGSHRSKSKTYAKRKAINLALMHIAKYDENKIENILKLQYIKEIEYNKEQKAERHLKKLKDQQERKNERKEQLELLKQENALKDKQRKITKAKVKQKKEKKKEKIDIFAQPMNAGKRRFLEDKMK